MIQFIRTYRPLFACFFALLMGMAIGSKAIHLLDADHQHSFSYAAAGEGDEASLATSTDRVEICMACKLIWNKSNLIPLEDFVLDAPILLLVHTPPYPSPTSTASLAAKQPRAPPVLCA